MKTGFYRIEAEGPHDPMALEGLLSKIESQASAAIRRVANARAWPPSADDRNTLSTYMGLQLVRTPEHRHQSEIMVDSIEKAFYENMTPQWASRRLVEMGATPTAEMVERIMDISKNPNNYLFVPHPNEHLRMMLELAREIAPRLSMRSWWLGTSTGAALVAGDHAPTLFSEIRKPFVGIGLLDAEEVDFPLDRYHALSMFLPNLREGTMMLRSDNVLFLNHQTASASHNFVFQHPDDPSIEDLMPRQPKSLMAIDQIPTYEVDSRTRTRLAPIFSPFFVRGDPYAGEDAEF